MNQKNFVEMSKDEVLLLNNGDESAREAWRDGFLSAITKIYNLIETESLESVDNYIEEIMHSDLNEFYE